jgi:hypothetical protein
MRYMSLICADEKTEATVPQAEMSAIVHGHVRFAEELRAAGKIVGGERLRPDAEASRIRLEAGQRQVTDGPFAETKEALGGAKLVWGASPMRYAPEGAPMAHPISASFPPVAPSES